jgi:hypothetical protein
MGGLNLDLQPKPAVNLTINLTCDADVPPPTVTLSYTPQTINPTLDANRVTVTGNSTVTMNLSRTYGAHCEKSYSAVLLGYPTTRAAGNPYKVAAYDRQTFGGTCAFDWNGVMMQPFSDGEIRQACPTTLGSPAQTMIVTRSFDALICLSGDCTNLPALRIETRPFDVTAQVQCPAVSVPLQPPPSLPSGKIAALSQGTGRPTATFGVKGATTNLHAAELPRKISTPSFTLAAHYQSPSGAGACKPARELRAFNGARVVGETAVSPQSCNVPGASIVVTPFSAEDISAACEKQGWQGHYTVLTAEVVVKPCLPGELCAPGAGTGPQTTVKAQGLFQCGTLRGILR